jgi:hypothetical protein
VKTSENPANGDKRLKVGNYVDRIRVLPVLALFIPPFIPLGGKLAQASPPVPASSSAPAQDGMIEFREKNGIARTPGRCRWMSESDRWIENPQGIRYNTTAPGLAREIPRREQVIEDLIAYLKAMSGASATPPARMTGLNWCLARPAMQGNKKKEAAHAPQARGR